MSFPHHDEPKEEVLQWQEAAARFQFAGIAGLVLASIGWTLWFAPFNDELDRSGTPLGGDFVMLYVAGQTVAAGETATLYDDQLNQQRSSALFPGLDAKASWPFRYPPTVAACMVPLSYLPFASAFAVFSLVQCLLLALAIYLLRRSCSCFASKRQWTFAVIGCPLMLECLLGGQSSILALTIAIASVHFLQRHQNAAAGAVLALALYKPNVLILFIVACVLVRPQILRGFIPTALIGLTIAVWTSGWTGLANYFELATQLASSVWSLETPYWKVHGLAPIFQSFFPAHGKLLCLSIGLLLSVGIAISLRRATISVLIAFPLLLVVNSLFNPYVPIYDLLLLIPAIVFASEASRRGELPRFSPAAFQFIAGGLFLGPHLSQIFCRTLGVQLFPLLLLAALLLLCLRVRFAMRASHEGALCGASAHRRGAEVCSWRNAPSR